MERLEFMPGDEGFDSERAGFQTAWRHEPAVIVAATSAEDVRAAVEYAGVKGLPVAVHLTGHGMTVPANEGVLINTSRLTGVRIDPAARTAWIAAGVRWEPVIEEAAQHGLAPLSGSSPQVGAVSYTLGGGMGPLARRYGYAADHVRRVEIVTADGRLRRVTAGSDPDLFWAVRGGGGNFGVVTGLEVGLVPVGRLYGGGIYFDGAEITEVLEVYRGWTSSLPHEFTSSVGLIPLPDIPVIPEPIRGRDVVHVRLAYLGDAEEGERLVAPLREAGHPLIDSVGEMPFTESGSIYNDPTQPHGYHGTNALLSELDETALRQVIELAGPGAPVPTIGEIRHLGGALAEPPAPSAVGHRDARYLVRVLSPLDHVGLDDARRAHGRLLKELAPWTVGRCLNFLYGQAPADQVRESYEPADWERLTGLKTIYDPANMFRFNHNIPPITSGRVRSR